MPSAKRDMRDALKSRVVLTERPQIVEVPGERSMPGAKLVAIARVQPNPNQPRKQFDRAALDELAESIRARGIMQPLVVRPTDGAYTIIMGERRYRAALLADLDEVPVIVREASDEQAYLDALIENLQRANLTDEEEAEAYRGLLAQGFSVRQIADRLGIAPSKVSRVVRVYEDPILSAAVIEGQITKSQAQEILVAPTGEKPDLVHLISRRRKESNPVGLTELRDEVQRRRQGVALRNTPPIAMFDQTEQSVDGIIHSAPTTYVCISSREQVRRFRLAMEEALVSLPMTPRDPALIVEMEALRVIIERMIGQLKAPPHSDA